MSVISTNSGQFRLTCYMSESDLEAGVDQLQKELFGPDRLYIDVKLHNELVLKGSRLYFQFS